MNIAQKIRWVTTAIGEPAVFALRAREMALQSGPDAIPQLANEFCSEDTPPPEIASQFPRLGDWIAARQFAIFEILYYLGESALPILRRVAYGHYDWTQGNAIEVLCRLAADGIETDSTVAGIRAALPKMRFEALLYGFGPLLHRAALDTRLAKLLDRFADIPAYDQAVAELKKA